MTQINNELLECIVVLQIDFNKFISEFLVKLRPDWFEDDTSAKNAACALVERGVAPTGITIKNWVAFKTKAMELLDGDSLNIPIRQRALHIINGMHNIDNKYLETLMLVELLRTSTLLHCNLDDYNPLRDSCLLLTKIVTLLRDNNCLHTYGTNQKDLLKRFFKELNISKTDDEIEEFHSELIASTQSRRVA